MLVVLRWTGHVSGLKAADDFEHLTHTHLNFENTRFERKIAET